MSLETWLLFASAALVVILVPELFTGEQSAGDTRASASADGTPLRSYRIELDETGNPPPVELSAATAAQSAIEPAAAAPQGATASGSRPAPVAAVEPAKTPPAVAAAPQPVTTGDTGSPAVEEPVPPPAKPAAGVRAGWVVQLGTFSRRENAERMAREAARKGLRLAVAGPDDRGLYRVRSTSIFQDRQAAAALQERLKALGYPGVVNTSQ